VRLLADPATATPNLTVNSAEGATVRFEATVSHIDGLNLSAGGKAVLLPGSDRVLVTQDLSIVGAGSTLDLNDNDMIWDFATAADQTTVSSLIAAARNGGDWLGSPGITSSSARTNASSNTTLGVLRAGEYRSIYGPGALFDGQNPDDTAVLVKYTYYGDANFSGSVNFDDYVRTDVGFNTGLTGWANGDFNYSGPVNFDDYVLIDVAFNTQSSPL
jgi:hypothetical protein